MPICIDNGPLTLTETSPPLNSILDRLQTSPIIEMFGIAEKMRAERLELFDFSIGEPDFDTPEHICNAGKAAIDAGDTRYTAADGSQALKSAIRRKFKRDNDLDYPEDQIVIGNGAKPLLASATQVVVGEGDEVIYSTPSWPSHVGMIHLTGGRPVPLQTGIENAFKITPEQLASAMTPRSRMLLLCSPSNPTGAVYSEAELRALSAVLLEYPRVWVLSDDLYEHIVFRGARFSTIAQAEPRLAQRTLTVNGVSKCYAMTGWRIGYAGGPKPWIDGLRKLFSQVNGGPSSISQAAAVAALDGPQSFLKEWAEVYSRRRDIALAHLDEAPGIRSATPEGAFYVMPNCVGVLGARTPAGKCIESSSDFARYLLEDYHVVVVPGPAFDCDPYLRISIATSDEVINAGIGRIVDACRALR